MPTKTKIRTGLAATISREKLQEGLAAVAAAVPGKSTLPVLSHVLIEATERGLRFMASDLDLTIQAEVAADVEEPGRILVPAKRFAAIAKELAPAPVRIGSEKDGTQCTLDCGRSHYKLLGLHADEAVGVPTVDFNGESVAAEEIGTMIRRVAFAASREESRPILNGVLWQRRREAVRLVATDGQRLAFVERSIDPDLGADGDYIVPPKALEQVARIFSPDDHLAIGVTGNHLALRSDTRCVTTRLIEGPYPNYRQVIPTEGKHVAIVDRVALASAARRCVPVAADQSHRIVVTLSGGMVRLAARTADIGEVSDEIAARINGPELSFAINASYLLEVLSVVGTEEVIITAVDNEKALTFKPEGEAAGRNAFFLLMPMRILDDFFGS